MPFYSAEKTGIWQAHLEFTKRYFLQTNETKIEFSCLESQAFLLAKTGAANHLANVVTTLKHDVTGAEYREVTGERNPHRQHPKTHGRGNGLASEQLGPKNL